MLIASIFFSKISISLLENYFYSLFHTNVTFSISMSERKGNIHLISGPMFAGKTTELLRLLGRQRFAKRSYLLIKFAQDTRYEDRSSSVPECVTHDERRHEAISTARLVDVQVPADIAVVAVDEG